MTQVKSLSAVLRTRTQGSTQRPTQIHIHPQTTQSHAHGRERRRACTHAPSRAPQATADSAGHAGVCPCARERAHLSSDAPFFCGARGHLDGPCPHAHLGRGRARTKRSVRRPCAEGGVIRTMPCPTTCRASYDVISIVAVALTPPPLRAGGRGLPCSVGTRWALRPSDSLAAPQRALHR